MSTGLPSTENVNAEGISADNGGIALAGHVVVQGDMNFHLPQPSDDERYKFEICRDALFVTDPEIDRANLVEQKGKRVSGTCEWILNNKTYQKWYAKDSGLLWISGLPGQGKTMISIYLTEEWERTNTTTPDVTFFFCDYQKENRNNSLSVLRGLLYQVLVKNPILVQHFWSYLESTQNRQHSCNQEEQRHHHALASEEILWKIFVSCIEDPKCRPLVFLLDGVDECTSPAFVKNFVSLFESQTTTETKRQVKILIVSRDIPYLQGQERLNLNPDHEENIRSDIGIFISTKVTEIQRHVEMDGSVQEMLREKLLSRSEGTFLWIGFVAEELSHKRTTSEILETLESMPKGLHALYSRIILQIDISHRDISSRILRWVAVALHQLTLEELACAVGIQPMEDITLDTTMRDHIKHCGPFLRIQNENMISLVHQSVRDYLFRGGADRNKVLEQFRVETESANFELAQVCLQSLFVPGGFHAPKECLFLLDIVRCDHHHDRLPSPMALHYYASKTWYNHVKLAGSIGWKLLAPFENELDKNNDDSYCLRIGLPGYILRTFKLSRLNLFCAYGLTSWVKEKCTARREGSRPRIMKNIGPREYYKALHAASAFGQEDVVRLLLKLGAKPNLSWRHTKLLISKWRSSRPDPSFETSSGLDADIILQLKEYHRYDRFTPTLTVASGLGHIKVVEILIRAGARVSTTDLSGSTALHEAARSNQFQLLRLLIDHGADLRSVDDSGMSALHIYCRLWSGFSEDIVRLFIDRGSDINAIDARGRTALHYAMRGRKEKILNVLVQRNADVSKYRPPAESVLHELATDVMFFHPPFRETETELWTRNIATKVLGLLTDNTKSKNEIQECFRIAVSCWNYRFAQLLIDNGATFDFADFPDIPNPLHAAVQLQDIRLVRMCLEKEVAIDEKLESTTPFFFASFIGDKALVKLLLEAGANIHLPIDNVEAVSGHVPERLGFNRVTALHAAVRHRDASVAQLLISSGADINATCGHGHSPLWFAKFYNSTACMELLEELDATPMKYVLRSSMDDAVCSCMRQGSHAVFVPNLVFSPPQ